MGISIPGSGLIKKAVDSGSKAIHSVSQLPDKIAPKISQAKDTAVNGLKESVHFSKELVEEDIKQNKNFARGLIDWGKSNVGTVVSMASHPVETAKAVKNLAENPLLNPIPAIAKVTGQAVIEGKNPLEQVKNKYVEGGEQIKNIGSDIAQSYTDEYKKNGAAGVAGYIAPDIALALLSGGSSTGVKTAAEVTGKAIATDVAEEIGEQSIKSTFRSTMSNVAKESIKSQKPSASDIVNSQRHNQDSQQNFLEALISNFSPL